MPKATIAILPKPGLPRAGCQTLGRVPFSAFRNGVGHVRAVPPQRRLAARQDSHSSLNTNLHREFGQSEHRSTDRRLAGVLSDSFEIESKGQ